MVDYGKGTCHLVDTDGGPDCDKGNWGTVLTLHWFTIACCLSLPIVDHIAQKKAAQVREAVFGTPVFGSRDPAVMSVTKARKPLTPIRGGGDEEEEDDDEEAALIF